MAVVVIGGHSRNIGKTSVMAELIRSIRPPEWVAVKITQFGHGVCSLNGEPCMCDPGEHAFVLTEERSRHGRTDTQRFLRAGARKSLWLRVRQGQLRQAWPELLRALRHQQWVMIESNTILDVLNPALYLFVLDCSQPDFKASAQKYFERADALITIGTHGGACPWPQIDTRLLEKKPVFEVSGPEYASQALNHLVRAKLGLVEARRLASG